MALGVVFLLALFLGLSSCYALYVRVSKGLESSETMEETKDKEKEKNPQEQKEQSESGPLSIDQIDGIDTPEGQKEMDGNVLQDSQSESQEPLSDPALSEQINSDPALSEQINMEPANPNEQIDPGQSNPEPAQSGQSEPAALDLTDWIAGRGEGTSYQSKRFSSYQKAFDYANSTNGHFKIEGFMENNQISYLVRFLESEEGGMQ